MSKSLLPVLSDSEWLVEEKKWNPNKQKLNESLFVLGNGYLGSRGILEEIPEGCTPGTYFAGLYDAKNTQVTELVNAPNPVYFKIKANGEDLDVSKMKVVSHYRALDMRQGILVRKTVLAGKGKKRYCIESVRFFSIDQKHIGAMRVLVTPLDASADIEIESLVEDSVTNKGIMTEGDKMHYVTKEKCRIGKINYLSDITFEHRYTLAYATQMLVRKGSHEATEAKKRFVVSAKKNQTICFTKLFSLNSTRDKGITDNNIKAKTIELLKETIKKGFNQVFAEHTKAWADRWQMSDIQLGRKGEQQRALRFNIYHLLILANPDDEQASIGARTLSAEGYKGHIFWDTELFMLPFFIYTDPVAARSLLMYRYNRLDPARGIAARRGYEGVQFPWESADKGVEATPNFTIDLDGRVVRTIIGEEEHIVCDIAFGTWHYYHVTGDKAFMWNYGLEMLLETARFWVSRGKYNKKSKAYDINGVMGCDEFHANTNNNAFTNGLARFNIYSALSCLNEFKKDNPKRVSALLKNINLNANAPQKWKKVADTIKKPPTRKDKVIEEYDGFFKLRHFPLPKREKYYLPGLPKKHVSVKDLCKTQYVKQGDTLILLYLLSNEFDTETKKANYYFYDNRTLHKSSLSPSTYAIMGAEVGDLKKAYNYFLACLYTDIHNLYDNTSGGIHGASLGATWQVVVNGFCGMRVGFEKISFYPSIPKEIGSIIFQIEWRGKNIRIKATNNTISFFYEAGSKQTTEIFAFGRPVILKGGKKVTVTKN